MPKTYIIYLPSVEGSVEEEWKQCLNCIEAAVSDGYIPVKLNIFADLPDFNSLLESRKKILQSALNKFGSGCPAINVTAHPPEKPWKVSVEATFIAKGSIKVTGKQFRGIPYIVLESEGYREVWASGISSFMYPDDTKRAAGDAFTIMVDLLEGENMSLDNLVRQWNYIGNILTVNEGYQNYQIFNEVRNDYYSRYRKIHGYPAATGVGMKHGGVILDFCAVESGGSLKIRPVENPNQVNAYDYGQQVLKGATDKGKPTKHAPQFERALLIANEHNAALHISGTASIIGQETIGKEDVGRQTVVTIENIWKITDNVRLSRLISGSVSYKGKFSLLRVYIRRKDDFDVVRSICNEHFPGIPAIYIEADICRDDLLMEIEAEADLTQ
jgi:hypothetical protein